MSVRALCMSSRTQFKALLPMPSHDEAVWALACQLESWLACDDSCSTCVTAAGLSDGLLSDRPEETCSSRLAMLCSCWLSCWVMACDSVISATPTSHRLQERLEGLVDGVDRLGSRLKCVLRAENVDLLLILVHAGDGGQVAGSSG